MATLVLSSVGGIVGGPIGAAIGGLLGQVVDRDILFRPAGRQGPRLTELAVQTSSYGTQLPRVFGTMRVAGCVIWSTDLIESHSSSRSGKGQPTVTSYSYSASFAVALSARAVSGVGRIWADGTLLRGAAGDWKSDVGAFRLHTGGEDQAVDPLIASAEGQAPAHRGLAYAVFEQLQLATFGNRIPSLTFELIADADTDAGAVTVGAIAADVSGGQVDGGGATMPIDGFSAYGDSIRGVLETLAETCGGWWTPTTAGVALVRGGDPIATVADEGAVAEAHGRPGIRRTRTIAPIEGVPRTVTVTHYDPARDYQAGLQRARRPGAGDADRRIELPAVLSAAAARDVAEAALARAEATRTTRTVTAGSDAMGIAPGSIIAIMGESGGWRVTDAALEAMVTTLTLVPLAPAPASAQSVASGGRAVAQVDAPVGRTLLVAAELPPVDGALPIVPRVTILATGAGAGWRRAALLMSTDGGARWVEAGGTAMPATIGTIARAAGPAPATLFDDRWTIEVDLARPDMTLASADDPALDAGANVALSGDELVQFGRAEQIGAVRWRLSRLLRGRRGTEAAIGTARPGDRFALLDPSCAVTVDLPTGRVGGTVRVMAVGVGEAADPRAIDVPITGASICPPSPVPLRADRGTSGVSLAWVRRSRSGWRWIDGTDVPLVEEVERYRVTVGAIEHLVDAPALLLAPAEGVAEGAAGETITVRQLGTNGQSPPATLDPARLRPA